MDAIRYLAHNGGVWRARPADFPPWKIAYDYHHHWATDGTVNRIHNTLREQVRTTEGRTAAPSAAIIDSQSVIPRTPAPLLRLAAAPGVAVQIVAKLAGQKDFQVLPRRWFVERTVAGINRCRRTVRDDERLPAHHAVFVQ